MPSWASPRICVSCSREMRHPRSSPDGRPRYGAFEQCSACYATALRRTRAVPAKMQTDWSVDQFCNTCNKQMHRRGYPTKEGTVAGGTKGDCHNCANKRNARVRGVQPQKLAKTDEHGKWCTSCDQYFRYDSGSFNRGSSQGGYLARCVRCSTIRKHGITYQQFAVLLEEQGGVCAICKEHRINERGYHIDHDHACCSKRLSCGKCVRGVLCSQCNVAMGMFNDDPERLRNALTYALKHRIDED